MSVYCRICGHVQRTRNTSSACSKCGAWLGPDDHDVMRPDDEDDSTTLFNGLVAAVIALAFAGVATYFFVHGKGHFDLVKTPGRDTTKWVDFQPPGQFFEVSFPREPRHHTQEFPTPAGPITAHFYLVREGFGGAEYCVSYFEIPPDAKFDREGGFKGAVKFGTRDMKRFVTSRLTFAGYSAMEIRGEGEDGNDRVVYVFRAGPRCYIVGASGASKGDRFKFFTSVDIRDPRKSSSSVVIWVPYECPQGGFHCDFPEEPTVQDGFAGQESTKAYIARDASTDRGGKFTVFYRDLPSTENEDYQAVIDQTMESLPVSGTRSVSEEISAHGVPVRHVEWRDSEPGIETVSAARLFVAHGRLYGALAEAVDDARAKHFHDKFRLLSPKAGLASGQETAPVADPGPKVSEPPPTESRVPPKAPDPLVAGLLSANYRTVSESFGRLNRQRPDPARQDVARALEYVMLRSNRSSHRRQAAEALQEWGSPASVPSLIQAADDESSLTARAAIQTLGRFPTHQALLALAAKLQEFSFRSDARKALIQVGPAAIPYVGHVLRTSRDEFVRVDACKLLGTIGTPSARTVLLSVRDDPNGLVRMHAKSALEKLGHPR